MSFVDCIIYEGVYAGLVVCVEPGAKSGLLRGLFSMIGRTLGLTEKKYFMQLMTIIVLRTLTL